MGWVGAWLWGCSPGEKSVSIPERVWGGLEHEKLKAYFEGNPVSIPERVWGGLEQVLAIESLPYLLVSIPERVWGGLERGHHLGAIAAG